MSDLKLCYQNQILIIPSKLRPMVTHRGITFDSVIKFKLTIFPSIYFQFLPEV